MDAKSPFQLISASTSILLLLSLILMADKATANTTPTATTATTASANSDATEVHIVYMQRPADVDPDAHDLQFLSSIVGSEEAAKDALLYSYKTAASGFSAKLTPKQVEEIKKREGVLQVAPNRSFQLHSGSVSANML